MDADTTKIVAKVGNILPNADSNFGPPRLGRLNDLITSSLQTWYSEAAVRGNMFQAMLAATTTGVAAGNITGAAAAASTQFALWNPAGSGVNVILAKCFVGVISGTPPGGPMFHNQFNAGAVTIAGSQGANCNLSKPGGLAKYLASAGGSTLTGGSALTAFRPLAIDFSASSFSDTIGTIATEELGGDVVIPPGYGWAPCWAGAGTTLLNAYGVTWFEFPQ
jgi:hypothetical protein